LKNIFFLFLITGISCSNDFEIIDAQTIVGKWRWIESTGGIAGITMKASISDQKSMVFNEKMNFEFYLNGKLTKSTPFIISNEKSIYTGNKVDIIKFPKDDWIAMSFQFSKDSLFLSEEVYDGFSHKFVRIKD
jgi:hypothetical protein